LADTVKRFNGFAASGKDEDFNRGENAYDLLYGRYPHQAEPVPGAGGQAAFLCGADPPGDIGTKGGLLTNENAQDVGKDGNPIRGSMHRQLLASVTGRYYPGAGATLGPAMTFGFLAAEHIAGKPLA